MTLFFRVGLFECNTNSDDFSSSNFAQSMYLPWFLRGDSNRFKQWIKIWNRSLNQKCSQLEYLLNRGVSDHSSLVIQTVQVKFNCDHRVQKVVRACYSLSLESKDTTRQIFHFMYKWNNKVHKFSRRSAVGYHVGKLITGGCDQTCDL